MSKKKRKTELVKNKFEANTKYRQVLSAIAFLIEIKEEEEKRSSIKQKIKKVIGWLTLVGGVLIIALSQISTYSFYFGWLGNLKKWYSDLFISYIAYIFIYDLVFLLEKYCKLDKKPVFGYIWPFIGFALSLFLTNSIDVEIIPAEPRMNFVIFIIMLIPAAFLMISTYREGKASAQQKADILNKASTIINDNPDTVDKIMSDYDEFCKNGKK